MKRNIGDADRVARAFLGALLSVIFLHTLRGHRMLEPMQPLDYVVSIATIVMLGTSVLGWSPLYALFRTSTVRPGDSISDSA